VDSRYEESILRSLRRMSRAVDLHSKHLAKQHELTGPQLVCLREILRRGSATPTTIAHAVSLSQGTVTGILARLEARQLLTRAKSTDDKRKVHLQVTERGKQLVAQAPSPLHEQFSGRLAALHDGEQAIIDWVLRRVVTLLEAETVDAAPMLMTGPATAEAHEVAELLEDRSPNGGVPK
jgi:DNA-binding MarR family transcriptional regulator